MALAKPYQAYFASTSDKTHATLEKVAACFANTNGETHAMLPRGVLFVVMTERFEKRDPF